MQYHSEICTDIDKLVSKWKREIRGLSEVATDDKGRKQINDSVLAMYEMYDHLKCYIADLEMQNMEMGLSLKHEKRIEWEHAMLKRALDNTIALDEIGQEVKKLFTAKIATKH